MIDDAVEAVIDDAVEPVIDDAVEPVIDDAVVSPGHDGQAVLVVRVRHANGGTDTVTLDADQARKLLEDCAAESADQLRGQPWRRLLSILEC